MGACFCIFPIIIINNHSVIIYVRFNVTAQAFKTEIFFYQEKKSFNVLFGEVYSKIPTTQSETHPWKIRRRNKCMNIRFDEKFNHLISYLCFKYHRNVITLISFWHKIILGKDFISFWELEYYILVFEWIEDFLALLEVTAWNK